MPQRPVPTFAQLSEEYRRLWTTMTFDPGQRATVDGAAKRIIANKARYQLVSAKTGVPWWWIGIVHNMECGLNFSQHLHNGDSLKARTWQVPAGRPAAGTPPFTWEESAVDALTLKGLQKIREWTIDRVAYEFERYNGWGYRQFRPGDLTPYLWSKTNHNDGTGKYVADGKWSDSAPSEGQCGAMATLRAMMDMDPSVQFGSTVAPPATPITPREKQAAGGAVATTVAVSTVAVAKQSGVAWEHIGVVVAVVIVLAVVGAVVVARMRK